MLVEDFGARLGSERGLSLCILVKYKEIALLPFYAYAETYAFAPHKCDSNTYKVAEARDIIRLRSAGSLDATTSTLPRLPLKVLLFGNTIVILVSAALLVKILHYLIHGRRPRSKAAPLDNSTLNVVAAMCAVAVSDNKINAREVSTIAVQFKAMTGREVSIKAVSDMLEETQRTGPMVEDLGRGLSDSDKRLVLYAALSTAIADGVMAVEEHAMVSRIAQRLDIMGSEFQDMLAKAKREIEPKVYRA